MAESGHTLDLGTPESIKMFKEGYKGYVKWNDGSISYYPTREIAKKELRRDVSLHRGIDIRW